MGGNSSSVAGSIQSGVVSLNSIESFNVNVRRTPYPSHLPTITPSGEHVYCMKCVSKFVLCVPLHHMMVLVLRYV